MTYKLQSLRMLLVNLLMLLPLDIGPLFIPVSHLALGISLKDVSQLIIWLSVMTVDLYPPPAPPPQL